MKKGKLQIGCVNKGGSRCVVNAGKNCAYTIYRGVDECSPCTSECQYWMDEGSERCALNLANNGEMKEQEIADLLGVSLARVSQIISKALKKARAQFKDVNSDAWSPFDRDSPSV